MRNMSFSMTTEQIKARTKTVTRRLGWWFLKPGDRVRAVRKCMGLKKGEKIEPLAVLEIVSVRKEDLASMTTCECIKEGFPGMSAALFSAMLANHYGISDFEPINRIEFKYV
jgi:hypothetical protein